MAKSLKDSFEGIESIRVWIYLDEKEKPPHLKNPWSMLGCDRYSYRSLPEFDESVFIMEAEDVELPEVGTFHRTADSTYISCGSGRIRFSEYVKASSF